MGRFNRDDLERISPREQRRIDRHGGYDPFPILALCCVVALIIIVVEINRNSTAFTAKKAHLQTVCGNAACHFQSPPIISGCREYKLAHQKRDTRLLKELEKAGRLQ